MERPQQYLQPRLLYFLGVLFLFSMIGLGQWGVIDTSEARYAHIAKGMSETGDYVHPVYLGVEHYHKPPLTYQMTALVFEVLGPSPFAARFLLQIALLLQCILTFAIGRQVLRRPGYAWHAVCIYLSFAIVWISVRNLTTDAYLNTFILASIWALVAFARKDSQKHLYLLALFGALGFLTKISAYFVITGPVGIAILWHYRRQYRWTAHIVGALVLFAAVVASWFVSLGEEGWSVFKYLLYEQSLVRYTADVFFRNQPWWYYVVSIPALSLPWIVVAVVRALKRNHLASITGLMFLVGFVFPIVFYSLSKSKLILYVLPCFPLLALFCADHFGRLGVQAQRAIKISGMVLGLLLLAGMVAFPLVDAGWTSTPVLAVIASLSVVALIALFIATDMPEGSVAVPAASMILVAGTVCWLLGANQKQVPTLQVVTDWLEDQDLSDRQILLYDRLMPSAAFHSDAPVALIHHTRANTIRELQFEGDDDWKQHYFDLRDDIAQRRLDSLVRAVPSIVISRTGNLEGSDPEFIRHFQNTERVGMWTIHY